VPVVDVAETELISSMFSQKTGSLFRISVTGKALKAFENLRPKEIKSWTDLHSTDWIAPYGLPNLAAKFCSHLPWTYWRYPYGLEKAEKYLQKPAAIPEEQPTSKRKKI